MHTSISEILKEKSLKPSRRSLPCLAQSQTHPINLNHFLSVPLSPDPKPDLDDLSQSISTSCSLLPPQTGRSKVWIEMRLALIALRIKVYQCCRFQWWITITYVWTLTRLVLLFESLLSCKACCKCYILWSVKNICCTLFYTPINSNTVWVLSSNFVLDTALNWNKASSCTDFPDCSNIRSALADCRNPAGHLWNILQSHSCLME